MFFIFVLYFLVSDLTFTASLTSELILISMFLIATFLLLAKASPISSNSPKILKGNILICWKINIF